MAKKPPGPKAEQLGAELRVIRQRLRWSMKRVADALGWSESTVSRLETGNRNIDPEEVSALLAIYKIIGSEKERLMSMARTPDETSWLDPGLPGLPQESVRLANSEAHAIAITDWSMQLVPGLTQTMDYSRDYMLADGVPESDIGSRLMARKRRQEILGRVKYTAYLDESILQRRIGGPKVYRGQLLRLVELIEDGLATIRITPVNVDGHPGMVSPFMLMEFESSPPRVHVELARSGVFLTGDTDTAIYVRTARRLDAASLDVEESLRRLRQAAEAIGSET